MTIPPIAGPAAGSPTGEATSSGFEAAIAAAFGLVAASPPAPPPAPPPPALDLGPPISQAATAVPPPVMTPGLGEQVARLTTISADASIALTTDVDADGAPIAGPM
ncbi:MAG: hypothetical protein OEX04_19600, partial [Acidimicrobiia bacterium]|nr:hypothetical protein [Acidimicrobiia bacterium]